MIPLLLKGTTALTRRSDHTRDQLRDLILDAAWAIVGKDGAEGLNARRIASAIGYTPGTLYNVFQSMDDISLHLCDRALDRLYETLNAPACHDTRKTPVGNMKAMADLYMAFARDRRPYWLMLFAPRPPERPSVPAWYHDKIERLFSPLERLLAPYFPPARHRNKKMAARILWSSVHGLCLLREAGRSDLIGGRQAPLAHYLIDTFTTGLQKSLDGVR